MDKAERYVTYHMANRSIKTGDAVMFDIDDTIWYPETDTTNPNMIKLIHKLKMMGYKIVIITARPNFTENVKWTQDQLYKFGIIPDVLEFIDAANKSVCKQHYTQSKGYNFILSVGDMWTDLGYSKWWLKLPDLADMNILSNIK